VEVKDLWRNAGFIHGADVLLKLFGQKEVMSTHFPYADINLWRRHDFLLAEELKKNICTMNEASVQKHPLALSELRQKP
jgi:hypothetical protein